MPGIKSEIVLSPFFFSIKSACDLKTLKIGDIPDMCVKQGRFIPEFNSRLYRKER